MRLTKAEYRLLIRALEVYEEEYIGAHAGLDPVKWKPVRDLTSKLRTEMNAIEDDEAIDL